MSNQLKNILILSYSDLRNDPRVIRQINALKDFYSITACGYKASDIKEIKFIPIFLKKNEEINFHHNYPFPVRKAISFFVKNYSRYKKKQINRKRITLERSDDFNMRYWTNDRSDFIQRIGKNKYDLIIANDIDTLPLALKISDGKSKVILDSHEYHPRQFEHDAYWVKQSQRFTEYLCSEYMKKADVTFAVSHGIAEEFRKNYNTKPILLTNATEYNDLTPSKVNKDIIKLIHHGAAIKARKIELMIEMMDYTDERYILDLMLIPTDKDYYYELKEKLSFNKKVRLIEPVKTKDIPTKINNYDIGLFILPPVNFNYKHALPNKFFEFVQARLAIAIGPSVEMENIVRKYELGIVSDDFKPETMAKRLNSLTSKEIYEFKINTDKHAEDLSAEKNTKLIKEKADELLFNLKYSEQV